MKLVLPWFACAIFASGLFAQEGPDSTKTYPIREFVVTATRSEISADDSPVHLDVLDAAQIASSNGSTVADVLEHFGGVFLNDHGSDAALKTLSMRGSTSGQVLVLVNGFRLNSSQNEEVDLSLLPLQDVDRIEVVHGGSSALYGADAIGGVVNVITRQPAGNSGASLQTSAGSFGYQGTVVEGSGRIGGASVFSGVNVERARDDYPFIVPGASNPESTARRDDNDFVRRQFFFHGTSGASESALWQWSFQNVYAERGTPGPFDPAIPGTARQSDNTVDAAIRCFDRESPGVGLNMQASFTYGLENYHDPAYSYITFYKNTTLGLSPQAEFALGSGQKVIVGGEVDQGYLESPDFDGKISRVEKAIFVSGESQTNIARTFFDRLTFFGTARLDDISTVGSAFTPKLGVNVRIAETGDLRLRASVGRSFRPPSLNDLYYRGLSNPNLRPERSTTFDAGITSQREDQRIELEYFHASTQDRILFDPTTFLPVNLGDVVSNGFEAKYELSGLAKVLDVTVNYSYTDAQKRNRDYPTDSTYGKAIVYVPNSILNLVLSVRRGPFACSLFDSFVGSRFITLDNAEFLPPYSTVSGNVSFRQTVDACTIMLRAEVENILDVNYQVFQQYPMSGRSYRFTVGISY